MVNEKLKTNGAIEKFTENDIEKLSKEFSPIVWKPYEKCENIA